MNSMKPLLAGKSSASVLTFFGWPFSFVHSSALSIISELEVTFFVALQNNGFRSKKKIHWDSGISLFQADIHVPAEGYDLIEVPDCRAIRLLNFVDVRAIV